MYVNVGDVFMAGRPETLENIKEMIDLKLNIQESGKIKRFIGVYYEWAHEAKCMYTKMTMDKDINKLVDGYKKFTGNALKVQKTPGAPGTTLSKSDIEEQKCIYQYIPLVGELMWYTTKVGPDVANEARELDTYISHTRPEHWKSLGRLIIYKKKKKEKNNNLQKA